MWFFCYFVGWKFRWSSHQSSKFAASYFIINWEYDANFIYKTKAHNIQHTNTCDCLPNKHKTC